VSVVVGAKLLYVVEAAFFPNDTYVPGGLQGGWLFGFRIPGGIAVLLVAAPGVCRFLRLPWPRFADALATVPMWSVVCIRIGCFLNGCCFGKVSRLPWALSFPAGSWVHWYHEHRGLIAGTESRSLPVHPLQLYFIFGALLTAAAVRWVQRRHKPGEPQLVCALFYFGSTAVLEPLRVNHVTVNHWLAPAAVMVSAFLLTGRRLRAPSGC